VSREDLHDRLDQIKVPALVIHGTADAAIELELAERLCSELGNCRRLVTIEGAGHACNLTHPAVVNLVLQQFLSELDGGAARRGERRGSDRRSNVLRRLGERRRPVRARAGRRVRTVDRRMTERRGHERRQSSREPGLRMAKS
jgi:hypothetical protein